jgi:iron-only hydrogenase group A|tara:strand:- start:33 stop:1715 length:1683 start_codon:yes stop_codon:yes gene_type:complete
MKIKVDGKYAEVDETESLLISLRKLGKKIPSLCYQEGIEPEARCRLCLIQIDGKLVTSCSTYPSKGMEVLTNSKKVERARRVNAELLMAGQGMKVCGIQDNEHELCKIIEDIGLQEVRFDPNKEYKVDLGASVIRDDNLCVNCGRCVKVCSEIQNTFAIDFAKRGHREHVAPYCDKDLNDVACIKCGQCIAACPVGAISEREHLQDVLKVLKDKKKHVVVQAAPAIRASIGENFGMEPGSLVTGKMVAALRKCGFDKVFDTNLGADMTIMEEASEFLKRFKAGGPFPMLTTCCPGWIKYMEHFHHELINGSNMSSCKSPHEMLGILIKQYYAKNVGIDKKNVVVVSIMPCTAKKYESTRPEMNTDVDYVLTTREASRLINHFNIDFKNLKDENFDPALGISTGAGAVFGATGGVMEAALRTAYELGTGKKLKNVDIKATRGMEGIKEGIINLDGVDVKFAVANSLGKAEELLKKKDKYHFIEIMACPGGCINGGGQPLPYSREKVLKRMDAIYREDRRLPLRKSHDNPIVKEIYAKFLGKPLSEKSEKLLHTYYIKRSEF